MTDLALIDSQIDNFIIDTENQIDQLEKMQAKLKELNKESPKIAVSIQQLRNKLQQFKNARNVT